MKEYTESEGSGCPEPCPLLEILTAIREELQELRHRIASIEAKTQSGSSCNLEFRKRLLEL